MAAQIQNKRNKQKTKKKTGWEHEMPVCREEKTESIYVNDLMSRVETLGPMANGNR